MNKIPKLLVGAPGIAKTAKIEQQYDYVEKLLTSSMVEEDIAGLIYREGENEKRTLPAFIKRLQEAVAAKKTTCLFLDEVDKGRREVVDTLLTLITHQQSYRIPASVDIVLAANPPEWGGGDGVSLPLLNRVSIIPVVPNIEEWVTFMKKNYQDIIWLTAVLDRIEKGEIPLLEMTGDNFERRITSPRSLTMSIEAYSAYPLTEARVLADGLLTPNASSTLFLTIKDFLDAGDKRDEKIIHTNKRATALGGNIVYRIIIRKGGEKKNE